MDDAMEFLSKSIQGYVDELPSGWSLRISKASTSRTSGGMTYKVDVTNEEGSPVGYSQYSGEDDPAGSLMKAVKCVVSDALTVHMSREMHSLIGEYMSDRFQSDTPDRT